MSSKWAEGLPRWRPHYGDDGQVFSLTHLHPTRFTLNFAERPDYPARDVEIRVGYASHAFTIRCPDGDTPHSAYSKAHDPRVFCPNRYQLSLKLPALVVNLGARRCYATHQKNYFVIDQLDGLPAGTEYRVFFNLRQTDDANALRLYVESAYPGVIGTAPYGAKRESNLFRALVTKTLGIKRKRIP